MRHCPDLSLLKKPLQPELAIKWKVLLVPLWMLAAWGLIVRFILALPKTRSGKTLRRAIQAVCESRDPGDLTTMEDPAALQNIRDLIAAK